MNDIASYYDSKDAEARRIRRELADLDEAIREGLDPKIATEARKRLERQLESAEYVGD